MKKRDKSNTRGVRGSVTGPPPSAFRGRATAPGAFCHTFRLNCCSTPFTTR